MTGNDHISPEDLALLALGTLPEDEAAGADVHLAQCRECRGQLAEFSGDVAMIGLTVPQHTLPAGARQRFMDRLAAEAYAAKPAPVSIPVSVLAPASAPIQSRVQAPVLAEKRRAKVFRFPFSTVIPWTIAAALAFFAYTLSVKNGALDEQLSVDARQVATLKTQSAQAQRVLGVLTSQSAQRVELTAGKTVPQPTGRAIYVAETGSLLFQASNLKLIAEDKTYELWVIPVNGNPIPAGLFRPDASGSASVLLPTIPAGVEAKAFGVTLERAEGSETPTAPILLAGAAPATAGE